MEPLSPFTPKGLFITGTDTEVGKSLVTSSILDFLIAAGVSCIGVKPVCCGERDDAYALQRQSPRKLPIDVINPVYTSLPAAPYIGSDRIPDLSEITQGISRLSANLMVVEGAGGWKVPVSASWDMEALAIALNYPVVLVVKNRLGALNHALLTAAAIQNSNLPLIGFVLNTIDDIGQSEYKHALDTNLNVLTELLPCPCLGVIPPGGGSHSSIEFRKAIKQPNLPNLPLQFTPKAL